jgi:hypothetical protein
MTDETSSAQQRLVVKLEENAMDSLVHGVEHHLYGRRKTDWKYVILHVFRVFRTQCANLSRQRPGILAG